MVSLRHDTIAFLDDLDEALTQETTLHCMGGFAIVQAYGLDRSTADKDVLSIIPASQDNEVIRIAGKQSDLRRKHGIYIDNVTIATAPDGYEPRLFALFPGHWTRLRLYGLEAHDLALSKLERNSERDRADVFHLARAGFLNPVTLRQRYYDEMRPYVIGRESWHDQTLEMWLEAYFPN